jgi:hypothetical protein
MRQTTPTIWEDPATGTAQVEGGPRLDTAAWFAWLAAPTTTRFAFPVYNPRRGYIEGFMTIRKEPRARGGLYWTAYWRVCGHLRKVYLGHDAAVTYTRLHTISVTWFAQSPAASPQEIGS